MFLLLPGTDLAVKRPVRIAIGVGPDGEVGRGDGSCRFLSLEVAHRALAVHLDAVRAVDESIEDRVGDRGLADQLVPVFDFELTGDDRGLSVLSILDELEEIAAFGVVESGESEVVQNEQIGLGEPLEQLGIRTGASCNEEVLQHARNAEVKGRVSLTTRLMSQGAGDPGLAQACWARD